MAVLLWMSIGSFSRTEARELLAQRVIAALCVTSAVLLFALHQMGGELWGSRNMARPMAVIAVIVALAGMLTSKGKPIRTKSRRCGGKRSNLLAFELVVDEGTHVRGQLAVDEDDVVDVFEFHQ